MKNDQKNTPQETQKNQDDSLKKQAGSQGSKVGEPNAGNGYQKPRTTLDDMDIGNDDEDDVY